MAIFLVTTDGTEAEAMSASIASVAPKDNLEISLGTWLVSHKGVAKDVSNALGIGLEKRMSGIVIQVAPSYFGWAEAEVWDWLKTKFETADGAS